MRNIASENDRAEGPAEALLEGQPRRAATATTLVHDTYDHRD